MAFHKIISKRLFNDVQRSAKSNFSISSPSRAVVSLLSESLNSPVSREKVFFQRFIHRRALDRSATKLPEFLSLPVGDKIRESLRRGDIVGDRLRQLSPPESAGESPLGLSASDARKILRLAQMAKLKSKLREISENSIPYSEFSRICIEGCDNEEQGLELAKMLDQSGNVIILGNVVFLRPEQIAKSMERVISQSIANAEDPRKRELEKMEKRKALIDRRAVELVKGELYCGLGFVLAQTVVAMRLTFWELTWDVMEPICFFVTSVHFALGYGFFLRTSTEPTFQGFFHRRFLTKQKRLMDLHNFDFQRYCHLRNAFQFNHHQERDSDLLSALNHH